MIQERRWVLESQVFVEHVEKKINARRKEDAARREKEEQIAHRSRKK